MKLNEAKRKVKKIIGAKARRCYEASETIYHLVGGKEAGYKPASIWHEGISHWYLVGPNNQIVDITVDQFDTRPNYSQGCGRGFLTKKPSKKAAKLIAEVIGNGSR